MSEQTERPTADKENEGEPRKPADRAGQEGEGPRTVTEMARQDPVPAQQVVVPEQEDA